MVASLKQPHSKPSSGTLPGSAHHKVFRSAKRRIPQELQKTSVIPPTITHSSWRTYLRSQLWCNTSILHTPPNPALTPPTSPLISDPPWLHMPHGCILQSPICYCRPVSHGLRHHVPPTLLSRHKHWAHKNHVAWAKNSGYTKPCAQILAPWAQHVPRAHTRPITCNTIPQIWLIFDLARNRSLDSENQGTIDNSLWWKYLQFEWQQLAGSLSSSVPS